MTCSSRYMRQKLWVAECSKRQSKTHYKYHDTIELDSKPVKSKE